MAHDFNNLLTAMVGNLDGVRLAPDDPNRPALAAVERAVGRAADLTRKLLGFARRNQIVLGPVNPRDAFDEVVGLLRRAFDPRIRITIGVAARCGPVQADPALLTQSLMNLCLNARDVMPAGGTLSLTAEPVVVTADEAAANPEARPGPFVRLSVADTGCGMSDAVRERLFEPFFTTKDVGKGTGLGLAMVQGIVKQHGGWIDYTTAEGRGTRFDLYLPAAPRTDAGGSRLVHLGSDSAGKLPALPVEKWTGPAKGTVLVVDDETMILTLARITLERGGFEVLTAEDGDEAVGLFAQKHDRIDFVVLDMTMPRMSGRDAFRLLVEIAPTVRVLLSTGYSAEDVTELDGAIGLLKKPYRPAELLAAVREALAVPVP